MNASKVLTQVRPAASGLSVPVLERGGVIAEAIAALGEAGRLSRSDVRALIGQDAKASSKTKGRRS